MTRITEEMLIALGLSMIKIGFTPKDIDAVLNSITMNLAMEILAKINNKNRAEE